MAGKGAGGLQGRYLANGVGPVTGVAPLAVGVVAQLFDDKGVFIGDFGNGADMVLVQVAQLVAEEGAGVVFFGFEDGDGSAPGHNVMDVGDPAGGDFLLIQSADVEGGLAVAVDLFEPGPVGAVAEVDGGGALADALQLVIGGPLLAAGLTGGEVPARELVAVGIVGHGVAAGGGHGMGAGSTAVGVAADTGLEGDVAEGVVVIVLDRVGLAAVVEGTVLQPVE